MKNLIVASVAILGIALVGSTVAEAGNGYSFGIHYGGHGGQYGHGGHSSHYGHGYGGHGSNYGSYGNYGGYGHGYGQQGHYYPHTTTHYDYHRPSLQWHGNHFDYVPGHYHPHTTTHFDYHYGH